MNRRIAVTFLVSLIVLIIWGVRVYSVNKDVAKKYDIDSFEVGQLIPIDSAELIVSNIQYGGVEDDHGFHSVPVTVSMGIKNTSGDTINILRIIESKLSYGLDYYQTMEGNYDTDQLRNLQANETAEISLIFHVHAKYKDEIAKLFIDQSLYSKKVIDKYQGGERYGISVNL